MKNEEIVKLFNRIKNHYNTFTTGDDKVQEWHRFLKDYSSEDVNNKLDEYLQCEHDQPPLCMSLIRGINKIKKSDSTDIWLTRCDLCKKEFTIYNNDMTEFDKHYRRCQKIDFIDLMSMRYKQEHIEKVIYYEMSDEELEKRYRKVMDYYLKQPKQEIFKRI